MHLRAVHTVIFRSMTYPAVQRYENKLMVCCFQVSFPLGLMTNFNDWVGKKKIILCKTLVMNKESLGVVWNSSVVPGKRSTFQPTWLLKECAWTRVIKSLLDSISSRSVIKLNKLVGKTTSLTQRFQETTLNNSDLLTGIILKVGNFSPAIKMTVGPSDLYNTALNNGTFGNTYVG